MKEARQKFRENLLSALKSRIRSEPDTDRVQFAGRSETGTKKILTVL